MITKIIEDNIIIATIENGKYNSVTLEALRALKEMIDEVNNNGEIKGLILTGAGGFFSSGFDLPCFLATRMYKAWSVFLKKKNQSFLIILRAKNRLYAP